jgi:hypothetical protein
MQAEAHINALTVKHSDLDKLINSEQLRPIPDTIMLHELKREKLKLKDEIEKYMHMVS